MIDVGASMAAWIPQVQGQYVDMDSSYGAQCWDLAAHWSVTLGLPIINTAGPGRWPGWAGNMVDAFPQSGAIAAAYELVSPDASGQPGDIVVWDDSYWYYPKTHVAVLVRDPGAQLLCMSQNSTPSQAGNPYPQWTTGPSTIQHLPRTGLLGFIRPRSGLAPQGTITPAEEPEVITPEDIEAIARRTADILWPSILISQEQFHNVTRANVIGELSKKIADTGYDVKVFDQATDQQERATIVNEIRANADAVANLIKDGA